MKIKASRVLEAAVYYWVCVLGFEALTLPSRESYLQALQSDEKSPALLSVAAVMFACAFLYTVRTPNLVRHAVFSDAGRALLFLTAFLIFLSSLLRVDILATAYAFLFICFLTVISLANDILGRAFLRNLSWLLISIPLAALLLHGLPQNRWVGGIHPNLFAAFPLAAAFLAGRSFSRSSPVVYILSLLLSTFVESRYAITAILLLIAFHIVSKYVGRRKRLFQLGVIIAAAGSLLLLVAPWILENVLLIKDPFRGLGSGFSGRVDLWENFSFQFIQNPLLGYGFRARSEYLGTHNGYLDFVLENGIIIAGVFLVLVVSRFFATLNASFRDLSQIVATGEWVSWLLAVFFMPQIINFGDGFAVMTLFLLTTRSPWSSGRAKGTAARRKIGCDSSLVAVSATRAGDPPRGSRNR